MELRRIQREHHLPLLGGLQPRADQLRKLVAEGLLTKHPYREPGRRQRYEYVLTEAGHDLVPILLAIGSWGEKHRPRAHRVRLVHADCGAPVHVEVRCEAGHPAPESEVAVVLEDRRAT